MWNIPPKRFTIYATPTLNKQTNSVVVSCNLYLVLSKHHIPKPYQKNCLHIAHCKLHTAHCTLHTAHCTLHTANCKLHTANCKLNLARRRQPLSRINASAPQGDPSLHTAHCTLHTAHCTLLKEFPFANSATRFDLLASYKGVNPVEK